MYKIITDDIHCSRSWRVSSPPASPGPGSWVRATVAQLLQLRRGAAGQLVVVLRRADWAPHAALLATRGRRVTLSAEMLRQGGELLGTGLGWVKTTSAIVPTLASIPCVIHSLLQQSNLVWAMACLGRQLNIHLPLDDPM